MEYIILMCLIIGFSTVSSKLDKIKNESIKSKRKLPSLKELVGKSIEIETDNDLELNYNITTKGKLIKYNDTWLVLSTMDKKGKKELFYFKVKNITSINIIDN